MKKYNLLNIFVFCLIHLLMCESNSYAAYVGNPFSIFAKTEPKKAYSIFTEGIADVVYDRGAKYQADDMKVNFYGARAGIIYKDTYALYGGAGTAQVEEAQILLNKNIKWESDYGFTWLAGAALKLYEKDFKKFYNSKLSISINGEYRNTDIEPDVITIDSTQYNIPHSDIAYSSIEYNDWHIALSCGLTIGKFSPYAGAKYSDFESCVRVMKDAILYQKDNLEADDNFGLFCGLGMNIIKSVYANIEAGFIDEDYLSASLSWKF
jgi:hypothetical protein